MDFYKIFSNEQLILVCYVDISGLNDRDAREVLERVHNQIPDPSDILHYIVPIKGENRIECINPKLISHDEYDKVKQILDKNQKIIEEITKTNTN